MRVTVTVSVRVKVSVSARVRVSVAMDEAGVLVVEPATDPVTELAADAVLGGG